MYALQHACGGQRTACKILSSLEFPIQVGRLDAKVQVRPAVSPAFIIVTDGQKGKMEKQIISSCQSN